MVGAADSPSVRDTHTVLRGDLRSLVNRHSCLHRGTETMAFRLRFPVMWATTDPERHGWRLVWLLRSGRVVWVCWVRWKVASRTIEHEARQSTTNQISLLFGYCCRSPAMITGARGHRDPTLSPQNTRWICRAQSRDFHPYPTSASYAATRCAIDFSSFFQFFRSGNSEQATNRIGVDQGPKTRPIKTRGEGARS